MTGTDQKRAMLLTKLLVGEVTVAEAAALMGRSERQVWRLKMAFKRDGLAALVHATAVAPRLPGWRMRPGRGSSNWLVGDMPG